MANTELHVPDAGVNAEAEFQYFLSLKRSQQYVQRNKNYFVAREAFEGRYRWPDDWPKHKPKLIAMWPKRIVLRYSSLLMGRGFSIQVPPEGQGDEERLRAQMAEKVIYKFIRNAGGMGTFSAGAQDGSLLGGTVFKTYIDPATKWPTFKQCTPDFFYGVPSSVDYSGDFARVFYSYAMDRSEALMMFPQLKGQKVMSLTEEAGTYYENIRQEAEGLGREIRQQQVSVFESWTKQSYVLRVGGVQLYAGPNPYGFVPFVYIPNVRVTGKVEGLSDVADVIVPNEEYNQLLSHRAHIVRRWLNPTLVWERPPKDYFNILQKVLGGGGAIPAVQGSKIYFLAQDGTGPDVDRFLEQLRQIALENANLNGLVLDGSVSGSINTGESLDRMLISVISSLEEKHRNWESGLRKLFWQLLELSQRKEAVATYGTALIRTSEASSQGQIEELTKDVVGNLRDADIIWPGALARDDAARLRLEIEKYASGTQSLYTTLENYGVEFPSDEIDRLRQERSDVSLNPEGNASLIKAVGQQQGGIPPEEFGEPEDEGFDDEEEPVVVDEAPRRRSRRKKKAPAEDEFPAVGFGDDGEPVLS